VDLTLAAIGAGADDELPRKTGLKTVEIYPAYRELDGTPAQIKLPILGSQTKCIAFVADDKLMERIRLNSLP